MSSATPPPPEPGPAGPDEPERDDAGVDSVPPEPFAPATEEDRIATLFGVLVGYNDAQADVIGELAGLLRDLDDGLTGANPAVPVGAPVGVPVGLPAALEEAVGQLRQLLVDEQAYLADERRQLDALVADRVGTARDRTVDLRRRCEDRLDDVALTLVALESWDDGVDDLRSAALRPSRPIRPGGPDRPVEPVVRRLRRSLADLTLENESQRSRLDVEERELSGAPAPSARRRSDPAMLLWLLGRWLRHGRRRLRRPGSP